jgi:superfamily II DNA or RNA helicase
MPLLLPWMLASLALAPLRPPYPHGHVRSLRTATKASSQGVTTRVSPHIIEEETVELVRQYKLEVSLDAAGSKGKSAVQREACAAIVGAFRGTNGGGGSSGSRGGSSIPTSSSPWHEAASRVTAVLPSGAGKTVVALRVAEALQAQLILVLVPSLELASQSYRDWERWRAAPGHLDGWAPLAVCSSTSVPRAELPRTTDATEVATFLHSEDGDGGARPSVLFCTYHSAARVSEALARTGRSVDLLICDEAHRTTGLTKKRDAQPLSDAFLPASRRLFLTATPKLIGDKRDADGALLAAGSMDDERLFGRVAYRLGYAEAIARGVVSPLKLVFLDKADSYARHVGKSVALGRGDRIAIDAEVDAPRDLVELSVMMLDCRERYGVRTAFAFSASNRRAADLESVADRTLSSRGFAVGRVSGSMPAPERERRLAPLREAPLPPEAKAGSEVEEASEILAGAATRLITNCRVLAEGVDLPAVDLVVFADAKHSHVDILQCMGRASRVAAGKDYGYVLVPVSEEAADGGGGAAHATAVSVLRAYAEQDTEFAEALRALVSGEARTGRPLAQAEWPEALRRVVELPDASMPVQQMVAERMVSTVARVLTGRWERMYGLLVAYHEREGTANVPKMHVEEGERLGLWLQKQRTRFKARSWSEAERKTKTASALSDAEVGRLEALGVSWDVQAEQWERMYGLLAAYHEREGTANVPQRHVEEGERLGRWLHTQRTRFKARSWREAERKTKTKASALSDAEVSRLEALGVSWALRAGQPRPL